MTEDERIAHLEELEQKAKNDKLAWIEFELERMKNMLETTNGSMAIKSMEMQDKVESLSSTYKKRFECVSSRIISLEQQHEGFLWLSAFAIGLAVVSIVAAIIGG